MTTQKREKKRVPELRFPGFEGEWEKYEFSELAKRRKQTYNPNKDPENYSCVELESLTQETGILIKTFNSVDLKSNKTKFLKGDVLFGKLRPYLRKYLLTDFDGVCTSEIWVLKGQRVNSNYLFYLIQTDKFIYEANVTTGSKMPRADWEYMSGIKYSIPSKDEQQKIALFLTSIDTRIQHLEKKKTLLEQYKKGVMQKIFSQEIRFKDDDGKEFGKWEKKRLGEYLKHKSKRNKNLEIDRVLSVSNTKGFILQSEQFDNHRVASKDVSNYKIVNKNEIAYNPSRINVGSIATLKNFEVGIVSPMYVVLSLKSNLNPIFFENLTSTHLFKHLVKIGCSGSVRDSLNFEDLESFKIKIPCLEEQTKIAQFLASLDRKIAVVEEQIAGMKEWKKGLLQRMFV